MSNSCVLIGYSGHAYMVADALRACGYLIHGYCDDHEIARNPFNLEYLGTETDYYRSNSKVRPYFISIGNNIIRHAIDNDLRDIASPTRAVVHPTAMLANTVLIKALSIVARGSVIQAFVSIGRACIVNTGACIDHGCSLSDYVHVGPNATLAGDVHIGENSFVGAGATVLPGIRIGSNATLGAGAVLTKNLPDGQVWTGSPARLQNIAV